MTEYSEILVEYDNNNLVVYVSGLDADQFWIEFEVHDEVNNPEDFAQGYVEALKSKGLFATATHVEDLD